MAAPLVAAAPSGPGPNTTATAPARPSPYVGPGPFERGQEMYGRDRDVAHLVDLLISARIVLLYSPSGAGKTSLIAAKLAPTLEAEDFFVLPVVRVGPEPRLEGVAEAPTGPPNRYVLSTLQTLEAALPAEQRHRPAELARLDLGTWFDQLPLPPGRFPLVIFDQFEEILTADPVDLAAKQAFFAQLGTVLRNRDRWALFAMREDFVTALDPYLDALPTRLQARYRLDLLDAAGALAAITEPARRAGIPFTDAAARDLVQELRTIQVERPDGTRVPLAGPYVEPVQLQVVCYSLWQRLPPGTTEITPEHRSRFGNVNQALADFYEQTVTATARASHVRPARLRRWFEDQLITSGGTRGLVYRGAHETAGLPNAAVDQLEAEHLIRAESRAGARWYELTHDRFIQPIRASNARWFERYHWRRRWQVAGTLAVLAAIAALIGFRTLQSQQSQLMDQQQRLSDQKTQLDTLHEQDQVRIQAIATAEVVVATATADALQTAAPRRTFTPGARETAIAQGTPLGLGDGGGPGNGTGGGHTPTPPAVRASPATVATTAVTPGAAAPSGTGTPAATPAGTATPAPTLLVLASPRATPPPATPTPTQPAARSTPTAGPTPKPTPQPTSITLGASVGGLPLVASRFGGGPRRVGIIGSLHGGEERPAYDLLRGAVDALASGSLQVPPQLTLYIVPSLNPDDLQADPPTGFNANGVDLNRNFPTLWTATTCGSPTGFRYRAYGGCKKDGGGSGPLSEPESQAAAALLQGQHLNGLLILNAGLNTVSSRNGGNGWGENLAEEISDQFGVPYSRSCCVGYPVTGQLVDWADSLGLDAVEANPRNDIVAQHGLDLLSFALERMAVATCTPTAATGEFALLDRPAGRDLGVLVNPGEEASVLGWARPAAGGDVWLQVQVTRPDDGRAGWMATRETNDARPHCNFDLDDPATFTFPAQAPGGRP